MHSPSDCSDWTCLLPPPPPRPRSLLAHPKSGDGEIPHLLFYGPAGSGKKTRVLALLKHVFGPGAERVRLEHRTFKTPSNRVVELSTVASNYHIEISPGDAGIYDRYVVQVRVCVCAYASLCCGGFQTPRWISFAARSRCSAFSGTAVPGSLRLCCLLVAIVVDCGSAFTSFPQTSQLLTSRALVGSLTL